MKSACAIALLLVVPNSASAETVGAETLGAEQLVGSWRLDREATLELQSESDSGAEGLPDFDFELVLEENGDARYATTVAGVRNSRRARWNVTTEATDEKPGTLELLPSLGTAKQHEFRSPAKGVLHLRAKDATKVMVLRRGTDGVGSSPNTGSRP
jgi:hypothetical protein